MSATIGLFESGTEVVAVHCSSGLLLHAVVAETKNLDLGLDAHLKLHAIRGLSGVAAIEINTNMWDVYTLNEPAVSALLLDAYFEVQK